LKCYIWNIALCGAATWSRGKADRKYLENFEVWSWRRMEIRWTDRMRKEEVSLRVREEKNILRTVKRKNAKWIGRILHRNGLLKHVIEGNI
jgi:hypothetical protein